MSQYEAAQDHSEKMCALTCCTCHLDLDKLKPLVKNAEFICRDCGRVAVDQNRLCDPAPLS